MINFLYFYLIFNYLKISKKMTIKAKKFQFIVLLSIMGIGDWGLGPIPNPQSPIPNPQSPIPKFFLYSIL